MRYRVVPPADRIGASLGPILVLYHRASGQTHLLAQPLPELLSALDAGEADADALLARLGIEAGAGSREAIAARLTELVAIGLVEAR